MRYVDGITLWVSHDDEGSAQLLVFEHGNKLIGSIPIEVWGAGIRPSESSNLSLPTSSDTEQK